LSFHGVLTIAIKGFDAQMLLDPFEEQFDLPVGLLQLSHDKRRESKVVGQKTQSASLLHIPIENAPQSVRIVLERLGGLQHNRVIGDQAPR
jgi:hypothetical protein